MHDQCEASRVSWSDSSLKSTRVEKGPGDVKYPKGAEGLPRTTLVGRDTVTVLLGAESGAKISGLDFGVHFRGTHNYINIQYVDEES